MSSGRWVVILPVPDVRPASCYQIRSSEVERRFGFGQEGQENSGADVPRPRAAYASHSGSGEAHRPADPEADYEDEQHDLATGG